MNGSNALIQIRFDERYPDSAAKQSIIKAFRDTGLSVEILPEIPDEGPKGGGGPVLDLNFILQHGSAVFDGLIAIGVWGAVVKATRSLLKVYAAVRLRITGKAYWRKPSDEGQDPEPIVTYELPLLEGIYDEEYLRRIPADYAEIVRLTAALRAQGAAGEWDTMQIEVFRSCFKPKRPE